MKDGELFVELMVRLHESARRWKGPGRPPNASDQASGPGKVGGRYSAAYRNSQEGLRSGLGTVFSSELVCGVTAWSVSRHAGSGTKPPPTACPETARLHGIQMHWFQQTTALTRSFVRSFCSMIAF